MQDKFWNYEEYNRPFLVKMLKALRLDIEFIRGSGDYLYYINDAGEEIGVLDLAAGMGSTILGHNNPDIKNTIFSMLEREVPMHAQGSVRETAGRLSKMLSDLYPGDEKRMVMLTNTGTEAVECALKHSEFNRVMRLIALGKAIYRNYKDMKQYLQRHPGIILPKKYAEKGYNAMLNDILLQTKMLEKLPPVVISTEKAYHGKTTGALSVTGNLMYREAFSKLSGIDARFVPFNSVEKLEAEINKCWFYINKIIVEDGVAQIVQTKHLNMTAFIMEPVQGEGGIHVATRDFVRGIHNLRRKYGFEWILDEIQSGLGRTGKLFAIEHYAIDKDAIDYVLLSKSLGGGTHKISATLIRESIHDRNFGTLHTSTFGEDSLSSEVALKALDLLTRNDRELCGMAEKKGERLLRELKKIMRDYPKVIREVRGRGLFIGIEFCNFKDGKSIFFNQIAEQGAFAMLVCGYLFHEHRIRTSPPLNSVISHKPLNIIRIEPSAFLSEENIDLVICAIRRVCEIASKANAYELTKFVVCKETPDEHFEKIEDYYEPDEIKPADPEFENAPIMCFQFHPLNVHQVMDGFDKSLSQFSCDVIPGTGLSEREVYWNKVVPVLDTFLLKTVNLKSPRTGDRVRGLLFGLPYTTSQMLWLRDNEHQLLVDAIQKSGEKGAKMGALIYGLGAFNSIVTHDGMDLDDSNIAITSGNSFTSALIWQSVLKVAEYAKLDLSKATAAIVGAGGNIGSVTANLLSDDIPRLILIGSKKDQSIDKLKKAAYTIYSDTIDVLRSSKPDKLKGLSAALASDLLPPYAGLYSKEYIFNEPAINSYIDKNFKGKDKEIGHLIKSIFFARTDHEIGRYVFEAIQLKHGKDPYITIATDLKENLKNADVVVSAVSSDRTIMEAGWFKPGAIVNDVSLPTSISQAIYEERPDVIAFEGGIGHLPEFIDLGIPGVPPGATLGCVAETFMLTMTGMIQNYSYGPITKKQVVKIWEIGTMLGFGLAAVKYQGDKKLSRQIAQEIIRKSKETKDTKETKETKKK